MKKNMIINHKNPTFANIGLNNEIYITKVCVAI